MHVYKRVVVCVYKRVLCPAGGGPVVTVLERFPAFEPAPM